MDADELIELIVSSELAGIFDNAGVFNPLKASDVAMKLLKRLPVDFESVTFFDEIGTVLPSPATFAFFEVVLKAGGAISTTLCGTKTVRVSDAFWPRLKIK